LARKLAREDGVIDDYIEKEIIQIKVSARHFQSRELACKLDNETLSCF